MVDGNGKVKNFAEKRPIAESRYLSAGIYMLNKASSIAYHPSAVKISMEEELFPQWLAEGQDIEAFIFGGQCLDIGTPERYQKAQGALEKVELESEGKS